MQGSRPTPAHEVLGRQRAIIHAVMTITVHPSRRRGKVSRREDVDIVFHTAGVGAARKIK